MRVFALLISVFFFLSGCEQVSNESVSLRLRPEEGDIMRIAITVNATQKDKEIINRETVINLIVDSVSRQGVVYLVEFSSLKTATTLGDRTEEYNSKAYKNKPGHRAFAKAINALYSISYDELGNQTTPFRSISGNTMIPPVDADLIQLPLPEKKVRIGDSWTREKKNDRLSTTNRFTYTLSEIRPEYVVINVVGEIQGVKSLTPNSTATGQYKIRRKDGCLLWAFLNMPSSYARVSVKVVAN